MWCRYFNILKNTTAVGRRVVVKALWNKDGKSSTWSWRTMPAWDTQMMVMLARSSGVGVCQAKQFLKFDQLPYIPCAPHGATYPSLGRIAPYPPNHSYCNLIVHYNPTAQKIVLPVFLSCDVLFVYTGPQWQLPCNAWHSQHFFSGNYILFFGHGSKYFTAF